MRRRSLAVAALSGIITGCLSAIPAQAAVSAGTADRGSGPTSRLAVAEQAARFVVPRWRSGTLTGLIAGAAGRPVPGACVTATRAGGSTMALSRPDGRYVLSGLRPGQYTLRYSDCASPGRYFEQTSAVAGWSGQSGRPAVVPGQVRDLPTVSLQPVNLGASSAAAGLSAARASSAGRSGTGQIRGVVRGDGHPVAGVCVQAFPLRSGSVPSTTTSASGSYTLHGMPAGRYQVEFAGPDGCPDPGNWLSQWYKGITTPFPTVTATAIRVGTGTVTRGINASLRRGAEIAGTVTSKSGEPLRGICVTVQGRVPGGFTEAIPITGKHGHYVAHGLFSGSYVVGFRIGCGGSGNLAPQWWRHAATQRAARHIQIAGTRSMIHADGVLLPGSAIAGTVRAGSSSGPPLRGICVTAFSRRSGVSSDGRTGRDGTYKLVGLAAGSYSVRYQTGCGNNGSYLEAARRVTVGAGRTTRGVDAFLLPGGGLTGTVTGSRGQPVGGICVQVRGSTGLGFGTETDQAGSYSFTGLKPGSYTVQFSGGCGNAGSYVPQFYNGESTAGTADPVIITAGQVTSGINATVQPGGTITGLITDASGHRLSDVCVGVASYSALLDGGYADIEFSANGAYHARNLTPGTYLVNFGCGIGTLASQWFKARSSPASAKLVSVHAGTTAGISAVMRPGGSIAGVVTDRSGKRLSGICAIAVPVGGPYPLVTGEPGTPVSRNGAYRIGSLAAGRYDVQFEACTLRSRYGSQWYPNKGTQRSATAVSVRSGRSTGGIDARLTVGGTISGQVLRASGKPAANFCVIASDAAAQSQGLAMTNRAGSYTVRGLRSGSYQIFISSCTGNQADFTRPGVVRVIAPHAVTGVSERLPAGGSMSGVVRAGSPAPAAQPNICVVIVPVRRNGSYGFASTGTDGSYRVGGLAPGKYQVYFGDPICFFPDANLAPQWFSDQPTQETATLVSVAAGAQTSGIDATLSANGAISGTVTGPAHGPVAGECATAVPLSKTPDPIFGSVQQPEIAVTESTGRYLIIGVQPGRYKVEFTTGCGDSGFRTQWWQDAGSAAAATAITVGAAATASGIDASLKH